MPLTILSLREKIEIFQLAQNRTCRETANAFNLLHPERPFPLHPRTVSRLKEKFQATGSLKRKKHIHRPLVDSMEFREELFNYYTAHPKKSTREVGAHFGVSKATIYRTLKKMKFRPYKMSVHQRIYPADVETRREFCERLQNAFNNEPEFESKILWSDESMFYVNGCFNRQNLRFVNLQIFKSFR